MKSEIARLKLDRDKAVAERERLARALDALFGHEQEWPSGTVSAVSSGALAVESTAAYAEAVFRNSRGGVSLAISVRTGANARLGFIEVRANEGLLKALARVVLHKAQSVGLLTQDSWSEASARL